MWKTTAQYAAVLARPALGRVANRRECRPDCARRDDGRASGRVFQASPQESSIFEFEKPGLMLEIVRETAIGAARNEVDRMIAPWKLKSE